MPDDGTQKERRERYLRQAREAADCAARSHDPQIAAGFRSIAQSWERLAREIKDE